MAKLLIIDDFEIYRNVLVRLFERNGYQTEAYPDAAIALDEAAFETIDVVITDLDMPMRGEAAIAVLRARGVQIPILVVTAQAEAQEIEQVLALGADKVLVKTCAPNDLLQAVEALLERPTI